MKMRLLLVLTACLLGSATLRADMIGPRPVPPPPPAPKLTRFIQVTGIWSVNGYTITSVKPGGPATRMQSVDGKTIASIQLGDIIVEVEGIRIQSAADYARAMNGALDPQRIQMKVLDRNTGKIGGWYVGSKDSPVAMIDNGGPETAELPAESNQPRTALATLPNVALGLSLSAALTIGGFCVARRPRSK